MKLKVTNIYTYISEITEDDVERLKSKFVIPVPYKVRKAGQAYMETKYYNIKFFNDIALTIPTGLLHELIKDFEVSEIIDNRVSNFIKEDFGLQPLTKLVSKADYSYQDIAVSDAIKYQRGLLHYPTGAGKTVIIAKIINELGLNSLIIVPNLLLLNQTYNSFCKLFDKSIVGRLGDGIFEVNKITIATQQTLYSRFKADTDEFNSMIETFDCLFIDECHHVATAPIQWTKINGQWARKENTNNSWMKVAMSIPAFYRFGMTATLNTKDSPVNQMVLEATTGRVISSITTKELIERNVLCPAKIIMIENECNRYSIWKNKYNKIKDKIQDGAYDNNIIENKKRNQIIINLANKLSKENRKVLVLVDLVEKHGNLLAEKIDNSILLTGSINSEDRKTGIEQFKKMNTAVLIGTIFKEGFDLPEIDTLIIATGGKSEKNLIQKIGRVLRVAPDKDIAEVYDFYDRDDSMCENHSKARLKTYKEQGYEVKICKVENL